MLKGVTTRIVKVFKLFVEVYDGLNAHDGWAIASHIAMSALLAMFPFLIFLTALASFFGTQELAEAVVKLLFDALPQNVAGLLATEVTAVLTGQRRDLLTIGAALAVWFSSSGVESLRVGLNRAYGAVETRPWYITRLQSIGFVLIGAAGLLALGFLVVLAPVLIAGISLWIPELGLYLEEYNVARFSATSAILLSGLVVAHLFLPAGRRTILGVLPGIALTLAAWLISGAAFGFYLARFASYASTYAGFAGAMISLVFLYFLALIFIIGGECNAALGRALLRRTARLKLAETVP